MAGRAGGTVKTRRPSSPARSSDGAQRQQPRRGPSDAAAPPTEDETGSGGDAPADTPRPDRPSTQSRVVVENGAGFLLAVLVWGWVIMPFLHGGTTGVKNMLRAKFLNKAPDGAWLP